jgi:hypothetical protein
MKKTWHITEGYIKNLFHDPKKQLLDPLCTLTSIIELLFRPIGTKFGIYNHSIIMNVISEQQVSSWQNIQSYKRYWYNDSRENVSKLGIVVKRLIEWYIMPTWELVNNKFDTVNNKFDTVNNKFDTVNNKFDTVNNKFDTVNNKFDTVNNKFDTVNNKPRISIGGKKNLESSIQINSTDMTEIMQLWKCLNELTSYFCLALETLIETYKDGNVIWTIQNFINLINDSKKGCYDENKIPKIIIAEDENIINFDKIKSLWTLKSLCEINELYGKCYNIMKDVNGCRGESDGLIVNIVKNDMDYNDSLDDDDYVNEKKKQIENYLSAIKIFINSKNDSFRDLIIKSTSF